jgi:hypothetical protein
VRVLLIVVALGAATGTALAQQGQGSKLHDQGRELAKEWRRDGDRKKLEEAARLFKEAYKLDGSPIMECDLGLALHYLGEDGRAHARLTSCMPRLAALGADKVSAYRGIEDEVNAALRTGHVAVDIVTTPPGAIVSISAFPPDETVLAPTLVWLKPGQHTFTAHLDGHVDATFAVDLTENDVTTHARKEWRVRLEPKGGAGGGDGGGAGGGGGGGDEMRPIVDTPQPRSKSAAYATLAGGGVLLAGGGLVHVLGRDVRSELATLSGDAYDDKLPEWQTYQRATIGLYAAGAVVTGVGMWLYVRAKSPAPVSVSPTAEGKGAMIWVFSTR